MAVDHSSIPKDLHPSATPGRIHPPPSWAPIAPSPGGPLFSSPAAAVADDLLSPRKVKLLCSFGGRIFPRPSDGILRYVGGHTRLISLRKDVSFLEFVGKMAEAVGASAVAVKYQLPGEDLDALISVSCPDDLVNMMEEYDKLAAASPDGSFKLRAFLFPPSELASAHPSLHLGAIDDVGQRYVEAVNGFAVSDSVRGPLRKDSFASAASSTQDSEGTTGGDAMEDGAGEGMSPPSLPSPAVNSPQDAPRMVYVGGNNPIMIADALVGIPGGSILAPGMGIPAQNLTLARPEQPPMAPYMPPAYVEPHQLQYITPQHLGMVGGLQPINVAPLTMHSYVPSGVPIPSNMSSTVSHVDSIQAIQPRLAPNLENPYGGKVTQLPADPNLRAFQSLSQLPPLPPTYLQPPLPQLQPLRLEDCLMCQKSLPHAHSDTLVQEHGIGTPDSFHEVSTIFYSQRSEDVTRHRAVPVATGALVDNLVELNAENMTGVSQSAGFLHPHIPEAQHASKRPNVKAGNRPVGIESPGEVSPSNGMLLGNHMREQLVNPLQQQQQIQQQQFWPTLQPPPDLIQQETVTGLPDEDLLLCQQLQTGQPPNFMVRQEVITNPSDSGTFKNANFHAAEPAIQDYVHQITDGNLEPIEGRMEALRLSPLGPSETIHQGKPAIDPLDAPSDVPYLVVENGHKVIPQFRDSAFFIGNAGVNYRYIPAGNYAQPVEQLPLATSEFTWLQGVPNVETNQGVNVRENHDPFPYNLGIGIGHSVPYENFIGMPMGFKDIGPVGNDNSTTISVAGLKVDCSQLHSTKKLNNLAASPGVISSPFPFSNLSNLSEHAEGFHELMSAGISFCDQDPWKVPGQTNLLPPKPSRLVSKEAVVLTDPCVANHLTNGSDIVAMLEEGNLHHPPDSMIKELCLEPVKLTKASEEEHIKQQLQAVAEDVAASVLLPSVPPASVALEIKNLAPEFNNELGSIEDNKELEEAVLDEEIEVSMVKQVDKENPGVQLTEDIGHLQIIKNSDLEELQELGSGTFGTVYHGKWRGSDVAIKRINDRCFAGKKSEEERMRADFWNEASKLADLHHPNVVAFYGVVLDGLGGSVATVTEYMVNGSLRHALLRNDKAFDQRKCLILAMDVAFGMEYLHAKNIIHFDLKSDNLLVNLRDPQRPICKVGDLGLSKVKCKTLISGGMRGTLPWMAPELLYGNDSLVSEKVDVFSFGVVMWEILTGEEPYADLHYGAIIGGILSNSLRPPVPESCNPEWRSLMEQCWSAEPLDRPSFTEVANRLRCMAAARPQRTATSGT